MIKKQGIDSRKGLKRQDFFTKKQKNPSKTSFKRGTNLTKQLGIIHRRLSRFKQLGG